MCGVVDANVSGVGGGGRMNIEEFQQLCENETLRNMNMRLIEQDNECQAKIQELKEVETFVSDFSFLSMGRDFIMCRSHSFSLEIIATALELTAGSIVSCCQFGCLADANSLLRKYRDDMFFYLYLMVYDKTKTLNSSNKYLTEMEDNIEHWIKNDLSDLQIGMVLKAIAQSPTVKEAVVQYNLRSYFNKIGERLNNYVHSNGVKYYNRNVNAYRGNELQEQLNSLLEDMRFITVAFIFLLTVCAPYLIMSTDYVDYLDCGETPPEGSQYWVAPFVANFLKENLHLIDPSCIDYLRENTSMKFD